MSEEQPVSVRYFDTPEKFLTHSVERFVGQHLPDDHPICIALQLMFNAAQLIAIDFAAGEVARAHGPEAAHKLRDSAHKILIGKGDDKPGSFLYHPSTGDRVYPEDTH